jgi:hypothetical protein
MKQIILVVALAILAGCATRQVQPNAAHFVSPERALALQTPVAGGGVITVVRDSGFTGSGCYAGVFVNGTMAAKVGTSEKVRLYLPAGRSIVSAHSVGAGLCGIKLQERGERAAEVVIASGDDRFYRLAMSSDGTVTITPLVE